MLMKGLKIGPIQSVNYQSKIKIKISCFLFIGFREPYAVIAGLQNYLSLFLHAYLLHAYIEVIYNTLLCMSVFIFRGPHANSVLWNTMIHPLLSTSLYGALWYQGEQVYNLTLSLRVL
jgi:hypothetical protein